MLSQETGSRSKHASNAFKLNSTDFQARKVRGELGSTWDAKHMTDFLSQSHFSNWGQFAEARKSLSLRHESEHKRSGRQKTCEYFLRKTRDDKNMSKIGFTRVNPLISSARVSEQHRKIISELVNSNQCSPRNLSPADPASFRYQANTLKFRITDPLTSQHVPLRSSNLQQKHRLLHLIHKRHPHGMTGIDHPENPESDLYEIKRAGIDKPAIRQQPNSGSTYIIDRKWKSKGRGDQIYRTQQRLPNKNHTQIRKSSNDNTHGYDIISNCILR